MVKVLVIEDDVVFAYNIKIMLEELGYELVSMQTDVSNIQDLLNCHKVDILLSDIRLENGDLSYEVLKGVKNLPPLIFFTGFNDEDLYEQAKVLDPYMFMVKPFDKLTLKSAIEGAVKSRRLEVKRDTIKVQNQKSLFVRSNGQVVPIKSDELKYIKSEGNYCFINLIDRTVVIRASISKALELINISNLRQVHRKFAVNMDHIKEIRVGDNLVIIDQDEVPIGRKYKKELLEKLKVR